MSAAERSFFATNVLLYLFPAESAKADRAEALLAEGGVVSVQVLSEFVAVARRKLALGWDEIEEALTIFRAAFGVVPLGPRHASSRARIARATGYAIYDALIIAAATRAGCRRLWTEDMANGQETLRGCRGRRAESRRPSGVSREHGPARRGRRAAVEG